MNFVARVMRETGIAAKMKRTFRQTTNSNHTLPVAESVLDRDFDPEEPNTSRVADVTHIPTREGAGIGGDRGSNNAAERPCERKTGYGTDPARGSRVVERVLTVPASSRRQGRDVLALFTGAIRGA